MAGIGVGSLVRAQRGLVRSASRLRLCDLPPSFPKRPPGPVETHGKGCPAWLPAVAALAASSITTATATAAEKTPDGVEELVVTAQKRPENIQDVPLSIMAVSEKALMARGVDDVRRLERVVPGLRLEPIVQVAGIAVRIRGFGSASNAAIDPSVAPYIDGVYIPRPGAILSTFRCASCSATSAAATSRSYSARSCGVR